MRRVATQQPRVSRARFLFLRLCRLRDCGACAAAVYLEVGLDAADEVVVGEL